MKETTSEQDVCPALGRRCELPWERYSLCELAGGRASLGDAVALLRRLLVLAPPPDDWTRRFHDAEPMDALDHRKTWRWGRGETRVTLTLFWDWRVPSRVEFAEDGCWSALVGEEIDVECVLAKITRASARPAPARSAPWCACAVSAGALLGHPALAGFALFS